MALHINNAAVEQKVRTLAAMTGESMTDAIGLAVDQCLTRIRPKAPTSKPTVEETLAYIASFNLQPIDEHLSDDEILGFDPDGIPENESSPSCPYHPFRTGTGTAPPQTPPAGRCSGTPQT